MEGSKVKKGTRLCTLWGGVSRLGTLFGVATMLVFGTGCPGTGGGGGGGGEACTAAADCTARACQTAACTDSVCEYTDACDADHCVDDLCVECIADDECGDQADDCNTGTCSDAGACEATPVDDGTVCDDGDACTDGDTCAAGACAGTDIAGCCQTDADCADGETCNTDTNECEAAAGGNDLEAGNPGVDFNGLSVGQTVTLTAPDPNAAGGNSLTRQLTGCTCAWSVDPTAAGSFDPADACTTDYTVESAGAFAISVDVTCDGTTTTFGQGGTAAEATACDSADACDDGNLCTDDACVNNFCQNTPVDCDDAVACTDDACDADTGECTNTDNCTDPDTCNTDTGVCEAPVVCTTDADCDDGVFCNGIETCDTDTGDCVSGTRPCDDNEGDDCVIDGGEATEICSEGDDAAVCTACPSDKQVCSLGQDNLVGDANDNDFSCLLVFNPSSGTQIASLQTGDSVNGLSGSDTLDTAFNTAGTVVATIAGVETINVTNFSTGTVTLSATNISGVDTINQVSSIDDLAVTGLQELTDCGFRDINDTSVDMALTFAQSSTTSGTSDAIGCTLQNATVGALTVTTNAANGFESATITSNGTTDNRLTALTQTTGTSMKTANLVGTANLQVDTLPNTILTYDGSTMTGNLQLGNGTTEATYAEFATANLTQMTLGGGNDGVIFDDTFTTNDFTSGTLDCGAGTDWVQNSFGGSFGAACPLRNCEEVRYNASASSVSVNFSGATGLTTCTIEDDGTANTFTLQNVPATSGVFPGLNFRGDNTQAAQTYDTITYSAVGNTGSSDSLAITVGNRGTALNSGTSTTNVHTIGGAALTAAGFEIVSVNVTDGPATFNGLTLSTLTTLTVTGSSNVTLGQVDATSSTIVQVDASGVVGNFSATIDELGTGGTITTAAGNDTVVIGAGSTATSASISLGAGNDSFTGDTDTDSADTVNCGDGSDTVQPEGGQDTVTTGSGSDTVIYDQATASDDIDITDFTAGTGGDVAKFDISDLGLADGTEYVGAVAGVAVDSSEEIVVLTGAGQATDAAAAAAVNAVVTTNGLDMVIIYFNTTDSSTHIIIDTDAGAGGTVVLLGRLTNITTQAGHDALTTANIDSQA